MHIAEALKEAGPDLAGGGVDSKKRGCACDFSNIPSSRHTLATRAAAAIVNVNWIARTESTRPRDPGWRNHVADRCSRTPAGRA